MRPAEQLVAAHRDEGGAIGERFARGRLPGEAQRVQRDQQPAPEVVHDRNAGLLGQRRQFADACFGHEPFDGEIAAMHFHDDAHVVAAA